MKWIAGVLSIIWGILVAFFVGSVMSIDPNDVSIPIGALANAGGRQSWQLVFVFLASAFVIWAIPSAVLLQFSGKFRSATWLMAISVILGFFVFLLPGFLATEAIHSGNASAHTGVDREESASPAQWQCKNDVEVSCRNGKCETAAEGEFTPMRVSATALGSISICAYSGCWEGDGNVVSSDEFLILVGRALPFSTSADPAAAADVMLAIDRSDNIATLKVGSFAQPLLCENATSVGS